MIERFLSDLLLPGTVIQIGSENKVFESVGKVDMENFEKLLSFWADDNLFFLGCVDENTPSLNRASDADVKKKNYFYLDIDVRKNHPEITDEDIKGDFTNGVKDLLTLDDDLGNWRYIVYTGNGIHIYYVFDAIETSNKAMWKQGVTAMLEKAEKLLTESIDHACVNLSRLARLPGSLNHKSEIPKSVEIIGFQDKKTTLGTKILAWGAERLNVIREDNEKKAADIKTLFPLEIDTYKAIQSLPITNVVGVLFGWETDGKHFFAPGSHNKSGCFVPEGENYLVHGGTSHIPPTQTGFRNFELVKEVKTWDNRQVFDWFREKFPAIAEISKREKTVTEDKFATMIQSSDISSVFSELSTNTFEQLNIGNGFDEHKFLIRGAITRIGAYSNIGKSKFTYWLTHLLLKAGYKGILFSTEVPRHIVLANMLNIQTGQHFWDIMYRRYTPTPEVQELYKNLAIFDVTHTLNSLTSYEKIIVDLKKKDPANAADFIIVDFCQGVSPRIKSQGEYDQMSHYALEVQSLAQRMNICVVDVSQISNIGLRDEFASSGMIPFKGSGHLYSSADIGILLKRDKKALPGIMEVDIRKHKYMPPSFFQMDCHWPAGSFTVVPHGYYTS